MNQRAILVAGWGTDPARLGPIREGLERLHVPTRTWAYSAGGSIDSLAGRLSLELDGDARVHLVGHSLGGLIVSAAALGPLEGRVGSVTTVNSPWRGTWLGYTGSGGLAEELRYGSSRLSRLRDQLRSHLAHDHGPEWLAVGVTGDLGVPPSTSLRAPRAERLTRRLLVASGHSQSLASPKVVATVAGHVAAAAGAVTDTQDREGRAAQQRTA